MVTCVFIFDIIISFFTGYFHHGQLVMHQSLIARHYIKFWFVVDAVACIPWEYLSGCMIDLSGDDGPGRCFNGSSLPLIKVFKLPRLLRFVRMPAWTPRLLAGLKRQKFVLEHMCSLIFSFAILLHGLASSFGYIGFSQGNKDMTAGWVFRAGVQHEESHVIYLMSLHHVLGVITVGTSSVIAVTLMEKYFDVLLFVLALVVGLVLTAKIVEMMNELTAETSQHRKDIEAITVYMELNDIPQDLQLKVREYLDYTFHSHETHSKVDSVLNSLSNTLRMELDGCIMRPHLNLHPFLSKIPTYVQDSFCVRLEVCVYAIGEEVYEVGSAPESLLGCVFDHVGGSGLGRQAELRWVRSRLYRRQFFQAKTSRQ